ncbi:MAG: hypothetical protein NTU79_22660 [Planctomycetota bacterium]|nr:hypothetical protein [Planctomycetota bacterium]
MLSFEQVIPTRGKLAILKEGCPVRLNESLGNSPSGSRRSAGKKKAIAVCDGPLLTDFLTNA